jgi:predicted TIM-barrel fold metal-dependent hydrolase
VKIIDAHCHFWDLSLGINGWLTPEGNAFLGELKPIYHNYLPEDYLQDCADFDIEKVIHIEAASCQHAKTEVELLSNLQDSDLLGAIIAGGDLSDPKVNELLSFYGEHRLVKGIRQILNDDYLQDPAWLSGFSLLAKNGLSFDAQINPGQMSALTELANNFPDTTLIVNHAGFPIPGELELWQAGIKQLASCQNVFIKLSGFGMFDRNWSTDSIRPWVEYITEQFGFDRILFASNFPVDKLYGNYAKAVNSYLEIFSAASTEQLQKFFSENARRVYQLSR